MWRNLYVFLCVVPKSSQNPIQIHLKITGIIESRLLHDRISQKSIQTRKMAIMHCTGIRTGARAVRVHALERTDHWANQTPHELAHADPTVHIHTYIGYCIPYMQCMAITIPTCMAEPHTKFVWWKHIQKCTQVIKRNPEKSSLPQHRTIDPLPSTNFFPGLRFLARGVAFCCPEAE